MAMLTIHKADGADAGTIELNDSVFGVEPNVHCVRATVAQYMANQRSGTHSVKTRAFVSGGGRKPWKQKGTGRARQGSTRAPQWRHGAIIFGPQPRNYAYNVNQKVRQSAFRSIWSELVAESRVVVVESFGLEKPKTRDLIQVVDSLGLFGEKEVARTLLVTLKTDEAMALSARNVWWLTALNADNLNVYDLLTHDWIVVTPEVLKHVEALYA